MGALCLREIQQLIGSGGGDMRMVCVWYGMLWYAYGMVGLGWGAGFQLFTDGTARARGVEGTKQKNGRTEGAVCGDGRGRGDA